MPLHRDLPPGSLPAEHVSLRSLSEKASSCVQIEPRYVNLTETCFVATPEKIAAACDKNTIGVVGILGTTYSGHYEDLAGIDAAIGEPAF